MAFGQPRGYPASRGQMQQLTDLILAAGHSDLRDARGPLGLTQRQAGGRFTRDEADELIARLEAEIDPDAPAPDPPTPVDRRAAEQAAKLRRVPDELLAAELQRRGWVVMAP